MKTDDPYSQPSQTGRQTHRHTDTQTHRHRQTQTDTDRHICPAFRITWDIHFPEVFWSAGAAVVEVGSFFSFGLSFALLFDFSLFCFFRTVFSFSTPI